MAYQVSVVRFCGPKRTRAEAEEIIPQAVTIMSQGGDRDLGSGGHECHVIREGAEEIAPHAMTIMRTGGD